jgi:hypothetical protein
LIFVKIDFSKRKETCKMILTFVWLEENFKNIYEKYGNVKYIILLKNEFIKERNVTFYLKNNFFSEVEIDQTIKKYICFIKQKYICLIKQKDLFFHPRHKLPRVIEPEPRRVIEPEKIMSFGFVKKGTSQRIGYEYAENGRGDPYLIRNNNHLFTHSCNFCPTNDYYLNYCRNMKSYLKFKLVLIKRCILKDYNSKSAYIKHLKYLPEKDKYIKLIINIILNKKRSNI